MRQFLSKTWRWRWRLGWGLMLAGLWAPTALGAPHALVFNGLFRGVTMGEAAGLELTEAFTLEAWVYPTGRAPASSNDGVILGREGEYFMARFLDGTLRWAVADIGHGFSWVNTGRVLPENQWSHVAVTYDGSWVRTFVDGFQVHAVAGSGPVGDRTSVTTSDEFEIGSRGTFNQRFSGVIDEVRVWSVARDGGQIRADQHRLLAGTETGLLGNWRLDEGSGDVLADQGPQGIEGTRLSGGWVGSTAPVGLPQVTTGGATEVAGRSATVESLVEAQGGETGGRMAWGLGTTALALDGRDDEVVIAHRNEMNGDPANGPFLTVAAWVKAPPGSSGGLVNKYLPGSLNGWQMNLLNGELRAWYFVSGTRHLWGTSVWTDQRGMNAGRIDDDRWHHVAFQVDTSGGYLYVDGSLRAQLGWTGAPGRASTTQPVTLGRYPQDNAALEYFPGQISDVAIWRTDLPVGAINDVMRGDNYYESFLVGHWPLTEGMGATANDVSGQGNHGVLVGQPEWRSWARPPEEFPQTTMARLVEANQVALELDGVNDRMVSDEVIDLANQSFSVEFWARRLRTGVSSVAVSQSEGVSQNTTLFRNRALHVGWRNNDVFTFAFFANDLNTPMAWTDTDWHHWACTYELGGARRIYRDGVLVAEDQSPEAYVGTGRVRLGLREFLPADDWGFPGQLREVRLWGTSLERSTIVQWKDRPLTEAHPAWGQLKAGWRLSEGAGTTVSGSGGSGVGGVLEPEVGGSRWVRQGGWLESLTDLTASVPLYYRGEATNAYGQALGEPRVLTTPMPGSGTALALDSRHGEVRIGPFAALRMTNAFTVEAWVFPNGAARDLEVLWLKDGEYGVSRGTDGILQVVLAVPGVNGWKWMPTTGRAPDRVWTHVAAAYDGSQVHVYTNGVLAGNVTLAGPIGDVVPQGNTLMLGNAPGTTQRFAGRLDDVRVWNLTRSASQIQLAYNMVLSGTEPGLVAYYRLDEGAGDVVRDTTLHGHHGWIGRGIDWIPSEAAVGRPVVRTLPAEEVAFESLTLVGEVKSDGAPVTAWFEWESESTPGTGVFGPTTFTPTVSLAAVPFVQRPTAVLADLPVGTYRYRLVAEHATGVYRGEDQFIHRVRPGSEYAVALDGVDDHVVLANGGVGVMRFSGTQPFTVEAWVRPDRHSGFQVIASKWNGGVSGEYLLALNENGQLSFSRNVPTFVFTSIGTVPVGEWTHVAFVYDGTRRSLYLNGVLDPTVDPGTGSNPVSAIRFVIGAYHVQNQLTGFFDGAIDELRVWNVARSPAQIAADWQRRLAGSESNLVLLHRMDAGQGLTTPDAGPSGLTAELRSGAAWVPSGASLRVPPRVASSEAGPIQATSATLRGWVNPAESPTVTWFTWWPVDQPTDIRQTPNRPQGSGMFQRRLDEPLTGLLPDTRYAYRLQATSGQGQSLSEVREFTTLKLDCGWPLATRTVGGSASDPVHAMDRHGNVVVAGRFTGVLNLGPWQLESDAAQPSLWVGKVNPSGDWLWARAVEASPSIQPTAVAVDGEDHVVVVGWFEGGATFGSDALVALQSMESFVARMDSAGEWLWARSLPGTSTNELYSVAMDGTGHAVVAGRFAGSVVVGDRTLVSSGDTDVMVARVTPEGDWDWAVRAGGPGADAARAVVMGEEGWWLTGEFSGEAAFGLYVLSSAGSTDFYLAQLSASGVWQGVRGGGGAGADRGLALVRGSAGQVYVAGTAQGPVTLGGQVRNPGSPNVAQAFVTRMDADQSIPWFSVLAGEAEATGLALVEGEDPVVTGGFRNSLILGSQSLVSEAASTDVFLARLDRSSGTWTWARRYGGSEEEQAGRVALGPDGVMVLSGAFGGNLPMGEVALTAVEREVFLTRVHAQGQVEYNAWTVGIPVPIPADARRSDGGAFRLPVVTVRQPAGGQWGDYFYWSTAEHRLFAIRPVALAEIRWPLSAADDAPVVSCLGRNVWPVEPPLQVAGAPVDLEPQVAGFPLRFQDLTHTTSNGAVSNATTVAGTPRPIFNATQSGWSVLRFLRSEGRPPDPSTQPTVFEVVRTLPWHEAGSTNAVSAVIGQPLSHPSHGDPSGRTGFVMFDRAPVDMAVTQAALDRWDRRGRIVAVNVDRPTPQEEGDDLLVAWYQVSGHTGIPWPGVAVKYRPEWPGDAPLLVVASGAGAGPFPSADYPEKQVYHQPDPGLAGYNPNEEHALLVGDQIHALRDDLNALMGVSQPYVLLKHRASAGGDWVFRVWRVVAETEAHPFRYPALAGQLVLPPAPLPTFGLCAASAGISGPYHEDYLGRLYARAAGADGGMATVVARYHYRLQPTFFYDLDLDGTPEAGPGDCVPWLDHRPGGTPGTSVDLTFDVRWPDEEDIPVLEIGDSLFEAKLGMPGVRRFARARVIFDSGDPEGTDPLQSLVRLFDPLTERSVGVGDTFQLPPEVAVAVDARGRQVFLDLPFVLRSRLSYDALGKRLIFGGYLDASGAGDPLILVNVLTPRERERLLGLSTDTAFRAAVESLYRLTRNPQRIDEGRSGVAEGAYLVGLTASEVDAGTQERYGDLGHVSLGEEDKILTAGLGIGSGYVTVIENDDPSLTGLPVTLHILRVGEGPYRGQVQVLRPDNVFDERLTLRHSADFGGRPENLEFEWYYHPDDGFDPTRLPVLTDTVTELNGWTRYGTMPSDGRGAQDITLGEGGASALLTLSDGWFIVRYRGYRIDGVTPWSAWAGAPGGDRGQLATGWVNRVLDGINPFETRSDAFHASETATYSSMLQQAGGRYEGDISFNPSADNVNRIGLIEAYETVLRRGRRLSIDAEPPVDDGPANRALLGAASRIADLYLLLGNEAFADAADPTIGFPTTSQEYGSLASSIFAFQNQLGSLLEEELVLLRGRDASAAPVRALPVYNRLFWNFTQNEGEVAYAQTYNIGDVSGPAGEPDGRIDERDARVLFPQGHGDAWGHYLTATKTYYGLLRSPAFTWTPQTDRVLLAGTPVEVDYRDERKFARAAALKARTGAEIVDLTYRQNYVDDPAGQWQGYQDTDAGRAWGVVEWARRAGQGAFFDWVAANAVLPSEHPDPEATGIRRIDRTTVSELDDVIGAYESIQSLMDKADIGLNPVGLAKGVIPFDIEPSRIDQGFTHFEQIHQRAVEALKNAYTVFNHANQLSQSLRRNQDAQADFTRQVGMQERDLKNQLIGLFGYPYAGDIGSGRTYPSGYDGPDLYHYMYVNAVELTGDTLPPNQVFTGFYNTRLFGDRTYSHYFPNDVPASATGLEPTTLQVSYPFSAADYGFQAPSGWGSRRAPGAIQQAISTLLQKEGALRTALKNHDALVGRVDDHLDLLEARYALRAEEIRLANIRNGVETSLDKVMDGARLTQLVARKSMENTRRLAAIAVEGVPKVVGLANDATAPLRASLLLNAEIISKPWEITSRIAIGFENAAAAAKGFAAAQFERQLRTASERYEIQQEIKVIEQLVREEAVLRLEILTLREAVQQSAGEVQALIAQGLRLIEERVAFRKQAAAETQGSRYLDMTFRIFRNDALQKYRAQFDLAQRYTFLAAAAYDFETQTLGGDNTFFTGIIRQRVLGQMANGQPVTGEGLADVLAVLQQNFAVLKGRLGFNNPQNETGQFSLRRELFRVSDDAPDLWRAELRRQVMPNLWDLPEFRRYCRPFAVESDGPQPGLVIRFPTTINTGLNFFGWPLSQGDTAYDPTLFATKVRSVGVWFSNYQAAGLANAPRVYLVPAGADIVRTPASDTLATREWRVIDQKLPVPFPIGSADLSNPGWIPMLDSFGSLGDQFGDIQKFSSFRAYHDNGFSSGQVLSSDRLIGRSVWNTDWMLIIPGATFLDQPEAGLERFIGAVSDIKIYFQTYSISGN